ncbi:Dehydrogenase reductase SDR member 13 [Coemansia nantahalensis]|uniref:Dehydrogenase reductase SDR member 13 n=2 Tax=Coemansia TaxID=4863 RepID=A0ACC1KL98_9FUNG|nr:Dehydrogenase reductase SDR member 13 [Coemansia nantahalensis]KAJ2791506.1 Dehydrogenase reductase SDR member 13 [Coemansia helicoidea]
MGFSPVDGGRARAEWAPQVRQDGRRFIVTGANRGIGYATAAGLAALGALVVLTGHEGSAAFAEAMDQLVLDTGCARDALSYMPLDLRSHDSVREFAAAWAERPPAERALHGLVNNAGIAGAPGLSPDGFELCFQINYLSMFLLTRLLLPHLEAAVDAEGARVPARIVCVSSSAHLFTLGLPTDEKYLRASGGGFFSLRYGESKLCVNSFVRQLGVRLRAEGRAADIEAFAVHPGSTASGFWHSFPAWAQRCIASVAQDPARGARTSLFCATEPGLESGAYYADCARAAPSFWLNSAAAADLLWRKSCAWTGVSPVALFRQQEGQPRT